MKQSALQLAQSIAKTYGCTISRRNSAGEYRVNLQGGTEATAYYATDLRDAVATAQAMQSVGLTRQSTYCTCHLDTTNCHVHADTTGLDSIGE